MISPFKQVLDFTGALQGDMPQVSASAVAEQGRWLWNTQAWQMNVSCRQVKQHQDVKCRRASMLLQSDLQFCAETVALAVL